MIYAVYVLALIGCYQLTKWGCIVACAEFRKAVRIELGEAFSEALRGEDAAPRI